MTRAHDRGEPPALPAPRASGRPSAPRPRSVHIDIQRLTLRGYTREQQQRFVQALEAALARQAADGAAWPAISSVDMPRLDITRTAADPEAAAQQLVRQLLDAAGQRQPERGHG